MENISPKMAASFGVGFIGFILAAYSYNQQYTDDPLDDPLGNPLDDPLDKTLDNPLDKTLDDPLDKTLDKPLDKTLDKPLDKPLEKTKNNGWSKFWKGEYKEMRNKLSEK
jgi:hypothetical protein